MHKLFPEAKNEKSNLKLGFPRFDHIYAFILSFINKRRVILCDFVVHYFTVSSSTQEQCLRKHRIASFYNAVNNVKVNHMKITFLKRLKILRVESGFFVCVF